MIINNNNNNDADNNNNEVYFNKLKLNLLGIGERYQGSNPQTLLNASLGVADRGNPLEKRGGGSRYNTESLTVDHSEQRVWRVPCVLHAKNIYCKFRERVGVFSPLEKTKLFVPTQLSILFQW